MGILNKLKKQKDSVEEKKEVKSEVKKTTDKKEKSVKTEKTLKNSKGSLFGDVLKFPLVTEKSAVLESQNKYAFIVDVNANKYKIKKAVKDIYGVEPESVKTSNFEGKIKRFGRNFGKRKDYKKAIVSLPKGKNINIHEGV